MGSTTRKARNGRTARRGTSFAFVVMAIVIAVASVAWACTTKVGQTYWCSNHGTEQRSYKVGDTVCVHAHSVTRSAKYVPATGLHGTHADIGHQCMDNVSYLRHPDGNYYQYGPDANGHIGPVYGVLEAEDQGTWQLCLYENSPSLGATATGSVVISVT